MGFFSPSQPSDLGQVIIDGTVLTVKSAQVTATASGNTQILAAVVTKQIKILAHAMFSDTALTVKVQDAAGSPNVLNGPWYPAANGGIVNSFPKENDQIGDSNVATNVNLSANGNVNVKIVYVEV